MQIKKHIKAYTKNKETSSIFLILLFHQSSYITHIFYLIIFHLFKTVEKRKKEEKLVYLSFRGTTHTPDFHLSYINLLCDCKYLVEDFNNFHRNIFVFHTHTHTQFSILSSIFLIKLLHKGFHNNIYNSICH